MALEPEAERLVVSGLRVTVLLTRLLRSSLPLTCCCCCCCCEDEEEPCRPFFLPEEPPAAGGKAGGECGCLEEDFFRAGDLRGGLAVALLVVG